MFDEMVKLIVDKHNVKAEDIKYEPSDQVDPEEWDISTWSTLCLVPQGQSSAVNQVEDGGEPEEGEIPAGQDDGDDQMEALMKELPDFYRLIPKRFM